MENVKRYAIGTDGLTMLQIAFIVLKLCHVIDWSWMLVLAPTWIPIVAAIIILMIIFAVKVFASK